ncbi:MAG TPA: hypothetical protein VJT09_00320, partial [Pyrinomonadaceae bacterium]|nr:hypothetical protein [Pyrinomonadaceae bacterium]
FVYSSIPAAKAKDNRISFPKCKFVELKPDEIIQWGDNLFRISNLDQNYVWLIGEKDNHPTIPREHFEQLIQKGEIQCTSTAEEPSSALYWEKLLNDAKPNELKEAQRRYDILMRYYRREPLGEIVPLRTLERLVIQLQESGTLLR